MGYYAAGDYYAAGGLGSILSGIGGFLTKAAPVALEAYSAYRGGQTPAELAPAIGSYIGQRMGGPPMPGGAFAAAPAGSTVTRIHPGFAGRRYRRMNPGNFRALKRSMRRMKAFERAARQVFHFTHRQKGHSGFKFHRKRRK